MVLPPIIEFLKDKSVLILGFGREGKTTYEFIRKHNKDIKLTIIDQSDKVKDNNPELANDPNVTFVTGPNYLEGLEAYDLIIKSPGISLLSIDTTHLRDRITSQLELVLEVNKKNVIGVTGTKGKSTTSSLLYKIIITKYTDGVIENSLEFSDTVKLEMNTSSINSSPA